MSIVPHNHDFARAQCIDAAFTLLDSPTDWDTVISNAAELNPAELTAELIAGQPYEDHDLNRLKIFRLQTRVRIGLRHARGLHQYASYNCGRCGTRKADPVLSRSWSSTCVHCAEHDLLLGEHHMHYTNWHVGFDPATKSWGIAYQSSTDDRHDEYMAAFVVTGYETYDDAAIAQTAASRFAKVFNHVCPPGLEIEPQAVRPVGELFKLQLPLDPPGWRDFLTTHMRLATPTEEAPYEREIDNAIRAFFEKKH